MKASFEQVNIELQTSSFLAYWRRAPSFGFHWHYHPEHELTYIRKGKGTRLVGDHTEDFNDGDLVLLGPGLPHTWATEERQAEEAEAMVVQFKAELVPAPLLHMSEFAHVRKLLDLAGRGLSFHGQAAEQGGHLLAGLGELPDGLEKLTRLWQVLDYLGKSPDYRLLASALFHPPLGEAAEHRIDEACQHIHRYFTKPISLAEMAAVVNMTETSFCRFFKKMTGKAFLEYVNDLRVGRASQLLIESGASVTEVAFSAGFQSMTHFNRVFFEKKKMPPRDFRKKFRPA